MTSVVRVAYRLETGLRDLASRVALRRGWTPAALAYPGYGGGERVRVLGRVLLAPPGVDPGARRGIPGWRRLLTLEQPGALVTVEAAGARRTVESDQTGLIDATLEVALSPGRAAATLRTARREPVPAPVHVASPGSTLGVVCDIDDTVWITGLTHPLRAAWRTLAAPRPGATRCRGWRRC